MGETVETVESKLLPNGQEMVQFTKNTNGTNDDDAPKEAINNEESGVSDTKVTFLPNMM